jgi:CheY-like chemotaxis protein
MKPDGIEILLVEDNPDDLDLALMAIKSHNVANRIRVARDGVEALEIIFCAGEHAGTVADDAPHIVILDLNLPKVDGIEVLRRIRSDPETKKIPVIVMTSSEEERDIVDSYRYGTNSYIIKPINFITLSETVSRLGFRWLLIEGVGGRG